MSTQLRFAAFSDIGLIRSTNQDSGYASPNLLVLADGMGGAAAGDVASSVTVAHLAAIDDDVYGADDILPVLRTAIEDAHEDLMRRSEEDPELRGLGTTCIAILRSGNKLAMVHIGDSRAYLLRDSKLIQVTHDHTLVQFLVDNGQLTPEEAENHPKRNVIMRALGDMPTDVQLDESIREAVPGDRWLLSSDGLFGVVAHDTIEHALKTYPDLAECGEYLIELALAAGAPDNVTVVLAEVIDDAEAARPASQQPVVVGSAAINSQAPSRGGSSAAAKAAALSAPSRVAPSSSQIDDAEVESPRSHVLPRIAALFTVLLLLAGGLFAGYRWTQSQYYVYSSGGYVVIYRGIPQKIGPLSLSHLEEKSTIKVKDLRPVTQERLEIPITRGSLDQARSYVKNLEKKELNAEPTPSPVPLSQPPATTDSPTPSETLAPDSENP